MKMIANREQNWYCALSHEIADNGLWCPSDECDFMKQGLRRLKHDFPLHITLGLNYEVILWYFRNSRPII